MEVAKKARNVWNEMSSVLSFDQNPRRGLMVLAVMALVVVALLVVGARSLQSGNPGCTAILSVQRYGCIAALAGRTGNVLYCNQIGNPQMQSSCIVSVAEGRRNVSDCSDFPAGSSRNTCIENVSLISANPSLCDGLDIHNQSTCRYGIASAVNFSQLSYCMGIRNSTYQGTCTAQSYYHLALQTGNGTYCAHLPSTADSALVYSMGMQNPDSQWAGYGILSSYMNTTPQDFCYASLATPASHATCSQITNSTLQAACNENTSSTNAGLTVQNASADCSAGSTQQLRDLCYFSIYTDEAISTSNESWCGLITNGSYMTSCVFNLASRTANVTYCNALQDSSSVQSCIYQTQLENGNQTQ